MVVRSIRSAGMCLVAVSCLALAACGGGGGTTAHTAGPTDLTTMSGFASGSASVPTSIASASGSHSASKSASKSGARSSTATTSGAKTSSGSGGGGGHTTSAAHHSTSAAPPPSTNCESADPPKASDPSKAVITVCPGKSLSDGDTVTITGSHFKADESLLFMQCHYKGENANGYGPSDCNISIINLKANTTKSAGDGTVGVSAPLHLVVKQKFKSVDCTKVQCMVTVAVPIQNGTADNPHALIYFG